jgi:hypothetical protein
MNLTFCLQSVPELHAAIATLDPADARKYMKLCVDSGLWVPNNKDEFSGDDEGDVEEEGERGNGENEDISS